MKKRILALALAGVLVVGALTGCGSSSKDSKKDSDDKKITVAASATPHAEILEEAKSLLKEKGYELEVKIFDDYVQPNNVVESGEFDANYFQHVPYLEQFTQKRQTRKSFRICTINQLYFGLLPQFLFHQIQSFTYNILHVEIFVHAKSSTKDYIFFLVCKCFILCIEGIVFFIIHWVVRLVAF